MNTPTCDITQLGIRDIIMISGIAFFTISFIFILFISFTTNELNEHFTTENDHNAKSSDKSEDESEDKSEDESEDESEDKSEDESEDKSEDESEDESQYGYTTEEFIEDSDIESEDEKVERSMRKKKCHYFIESKNRKCKNSPKKKSNYCNQHKSK